MSDTNSKTKRSRRTIVAALLATSILGGGLALQATPAFSEGGTAPGPLNAPVTAPAVANPGGFADLVARVKPAVVNIQSTIAAAERPMAMGGRQQQMPPGMQEFLRRFFGDQAPGAFGGPRGGGGDDENEAPRGARAVGSGFIIDPAGWIVTNNHVVENASAITVTLEDGTTFQATIRGRDPVTDLALLKVDAPRPLPYVAFGDSEHARVGEWVVAVGSPFGLGNTVTAGIVSALGRDIHAGPYDDFIQVDAPINRGNSGGPLFDQSGAVIGVNTAIYSPNGGSVGIGFAIPASTAQRVVAELREHGRVERGWLGIAMQPIDEDMARALRRGDNRDGVLVNQVQPSSPAARAGLQPGDVITAVNGQPVRAPRDLARSVGTTQPDHELRLTVMRDGRERQLTATVAANPQAQQAAADGGRGAMPAEGQVGLALAPLSPDMRQRLGIEGDVHGVVVARVQPRSRAADSGLKAGDVILRIGSTAVDSPAAALEQLRAAQTAKADAVPVLVMRDGATTYLALRLGQA
jgi:serine protease Do